MTTTWFILARAVHLGACLLFFGILAFDRFVAAPLFVREQTAAGDRWQAWIRCCNLILPPIILLSGLLWFALVAMTMSGEPLQVQILKIVWTQTQFGTVCKVRSWLWLGTMAMAILALFVKSPAVLRAKLAWLQLLLSSALLGSLTWAGHGQESSIWHLLADILHLLVAGLWPAGLLPFAWLLQNLRRSSEPSRWNLIAGLVRRFSAISLGSVALLTITGFVNSWFLVGSFPNLLDQTYGRWLMAKIILFCFAVAIGAVNLLRLKPRLAVEKLEAQQFETAGAQLQFNVQAELFLGLVIVVVVAVLGILPPANQ